MKKILFLMAGFLLGAPIFSSANAAKDEKGPKVEESTPEADKAAVHAASTEADEWAQKNAAKQTPPPEPIKETPPPSVPEAAKTAPPKSPESSVQAPAKAPEPPAPAEEPKPVPPVSAAPIMNRKGMNEMKGKLASKSDDPRTLRLTVDGGYSVEFSYDTKTAIVNGGRPISIDDLEYGDGLVVLYAGRELNAIEIDRVSQAPRPQ